MKIEEGCGPVIPFLVGLILGSIFSFFIMVPTAEEKQKNTVCHNGIIMERSIGKQFTTYERTGNIQECINN